MAQQEREVKAQAEAMGEMIEQAEARQSGYGDMFTELEEMLAELENPNPPLSPLNQEGSKGKNSEGNSEAKGQVAELLAEHQQAQTEYQGQLETAWQEGQAKLADHVAKNQAQLAQIQSETQTQVADMKAEFQAKNQAVMQNYLTESATARQEGEQQIHQMAREGEQEAHQIMSDAESKAQATKQEGEAKSKNRMNQGRQAAQNRLGGVGVSMDGSYEAKAVTGSETIMRQDPDAEAERRRQAEIAKAKAEAEAAIKKAAEEAARIIKEMEAKVQEILKNAALSAEAKIEAVNAAISEALYKIEGPNGVLENIATSAYGEVSASVVTQQQEQVLGIVQQGLINVQTMEQQAGLLPANPTATSFDPLNSITNGLISLGQSSTVGNYAMFGAANATNYLNGLRQQVFFPGANSTVLERLPAAARLGGLVTIPAGLAIGGIGAGLSYAGYATTSAYLAGGLSSMSAHGLTFGTMGGVGNIAGQGINQIISTGTFDPSQINGGNVLLATGANYAMGLGGPWATSTPRIMTLGGAANILQYGGTQLNTGQQITSAGLAEEGVAGAFFAYLGGNVNPLSIPHTPTPNQIMGGFRNQFGTNGTLSVEAASQAQAAYILGNVDRRAMVNTLEQAAHGITGTIGRGLEKIELAPPNETTVSPNLSPHIGNANPNNPIQMGSTPVLGDTTTISSPQHQHQQPPPKWALPSLPDKPKDNNPVNAFFRK